jgi:hypothetical protein
MLDIGPWRKVGDFFIPKLLYCERTLFKITLKSGAPFVSKTLSQLPEYSM